MTTLVRTRRDLESVVAGNPFVERGAAIDRLHVTFSCRDKAAADVLDPDECGPERRTRRSGDEFEVVGREVYLHCPNGYGRSRLTNPFWERRLGTPATTRNWKTVNALVDLAGG